MEKLFHGPDVYFYGINFFKQKYFSDEPICVVNNRGRVEHHQEFWILVAGLVFHLLADRKR